MDAGLSAVGINVEPSDAKGSALVVSGDASVTGELCVNETIIIGNTSTNHVKDIDFRRTSTNANATARIRVTEPGATHTSDFRFHTSNANGGPNPKEVMRIDSDGRLGVGDFRGAAAQAKFVVSGDASITGDLNIREYMRHGGDSDTYIRFTSDTIEFEAGGLNFITLDENASTQDQIIINDGGVDMDFRVESNNQANMFLVDGKV